jgi:DNA polymerase (family 10)
MSPPTTTGGAHTVPRRPRAPTASTARADNAALADTLRELAARLELDDVEHAPRAYRRAADTIERAQRSVARLYESEGVAGLEALPGIGEHIAEALREQLETGRIARLERLRRATGVDVLGLLAVDGVGPKRLRTLWHALKVRTVADLEHAVAHHEVRDLPGFGARSEERLHDVLQLRRRGHPRIPLSRAARLAERLRADLANDPHVKDVCVAGSIRRRLSTVGDVDLVVASEDAGAVAGAFLDRAPIAGVHAKGPHRVSVTLESGVDVDLRIVEPEQFGAALLYFTGSRAHTIALRQLALAQRLRLNEYGLFRGKQKIAGRTEEEIYAALSLPFIAPEARLGGSEIRDALQSAREQGR